MPLARRSERTATTPLAPESAGGPPPGLVRKSVESSSVGLHHLDAFLLHARSSASLQERLQQPLDLEAFLQLARQEGFPVEEGDVLAAQQREEGQLSDEELQQRAGIEARRLRTFIPG